MTSTAPHLSSTTASKSRTALPLIGGGFIVLFGVGVMSTGQTGMKDSRQESAECANAARIVAGRTHSMLEGRAFRTAADQVYRICVSDSAAFRRIVR